MSTIQSLHIRGPEVVGLTIIGVALAPLFSMCVTCSLPLVLGLYVCFKIVRRKTAGRIVVNDYAAFITGCDTGFGHDLARRLDDRKFTVFAGCLRPDGAGARKLASGASKRLHVVPLDVTSDDSVEEAHAYVKKHLPSGGLWAIVNNAGFNVMGDVEWLTVDLYHKAMDVNFYGAVRTFRRFLYMVRATKGRVVIVTSVKGRSSWPADSAYHVTKHGLETMADSLRLEMRKFGVNVAIIEPGDFSTATACQNEEVFQRYRKEADKMWESAPTEVREVYRRRYLDAMLEYQRSSIGRGGGSTAPVMDAMEDAILSRRPHTRYMIAGSCLDMHTTLAQYYDVMPTWVSDLIISCWTGCDCFPDYRKLKLE
ncbi:hypothetical protein DPMN_053953 [Dreissena polymorpha]|uniref:Uncharacterized protein n=1 Tax=Dreissena polymorpha TaxID=45954 RepID=A0A9D4HSP1_DREPO|nr:hypothetical protein DPMN_053953 [Dreissena polymorpha]